MKKVAILGASGLLGKHLFNHFKKTGTDCIRLGRSLNESIDTAIDFTNIDKAFEILDSLNVDCIINLIAMTSVDSCEENISEAYFVNTKIPEIISQWCHSNKTTSLIHISTDHFYSDAGESTEECVKIYNTYAMTKYAAELAVMNCNGTILRTNFFGKSHTFGRKSFSDWIFESLSSGKNIIGYSDNYFSALHISTLCAIINNVCETPKPGIFNVGSKNGFSKGEFAKRFCSALNLDESLIELASSDDAVNIIKRPSDMRMNSGKFVGEYPLISLPLLSEEVLKAAKEYNF